MVTLAWSATLQSSIITAAEGLCVASLTVNTIAMMRTDERFSLFWELVQKNAAVVHVNEPRLPRRWQVPERFEKGDGSAHFPATVEAHYCWIYFEVLDYMQSLPSR